MNNGHSLTELEKFAPIRDRMEERLRLKRVKPADAFEEEKKLLGHLYDIFGEAVFIPTKIWGPPDESGRFGAKGAPLCKYWPKLTYKNSLHSQHQEMLYERIKGDSNKPGWVGNIAVLLGEPSNNLVSIDIDDAEWIEPFLQANPALRETTQVPTYRGRQIFLRLLGNYPKTVCQLTANGTAIGEFRGGKGLSTIFGHHPKGTIENPVLYCPSSETVITCRYKDLVLPAGVTLDDSSRTARKDRKSRKKYSLRGKPRSIDTGSLHEAIEGDVEALCAALFPNGRMVGAEFRLADKKGNAPRGQGSLTVQTTGEYAGYWIDWATGDDGDLIDLVKSVYGGGFEGAVKKIEEALGESFRVPAENGETDLDSKPILDLIYDVSNNAYYVPAPDGGYHLLRIDGLRRHLKKKYHLDGDVGKNETLSEIDQVIEHAENHTRADIVGDYAGYWDAKRYTVAGGYKLLVPRPCRRVTPGEGNWDYARGFLEGIFKDSLELKVFYGWLRNCWLSSLEEPGEWWPQQALVLKGIPDNGKSAIQKTIITPILGRHADPTQYFTGQTSFNADLAQAEHWMLSDPKWTTKAEKEAFASAFKEAVANSTVDVHPKQQQKRQLEIFRRVTLSINDEEEPMSIFPLMPPSTIEKLIFLQTDGKSAFTPKGGSAWSTWKRQIISEIPAFLYYLTNEFEIPEEIRHDRYGVAYRNAAIEEKVKAPSSEEKSLTEEEILYEAIFTGDGRMVNERSLTSVEICKLLQDPNFKLVQVAKVVFPLSPNHLGRRVNGLMREQEKRSPSRIRIATETKDHKAVFIFRKI